MKVSELIEILENEDPDATVLLAQQPSWPFEYDVRGVVARHEFDEEDDACRGPDDDRRANDVFIVEGSQLRYGNRDAWDAARGRY